MEWIDAFERDFQTFYSTGNLALADHKTTATVCSLGPQLLSDCGCGKSFRPDRPSIVVCFRCMMYVEAKIK